MQTVKDLIVPIDQNEEDEFKNNPYYLFRDPLIKNKHLSKNQRIINTRKHQVLDN